MPYDNPDVKAIAGAAKNSDAYKAMAGDEPEAPGEGDSEAEDLREAFDAKDADSFAASMLAAIKSCIKNYGAGK